MKLPRTIFCAALCIMLFGCASASDIRAKEPDFRFITVTADQADYIDCLDDRIEVENAGAAIARTTRGGIVHIAGHLAGRGDFFLWDVDLTPVGKNQIEVTLRSMTNAWGASQFSGDLRQMSAKCAQ